MKTGTRAKEKPNRKSGAETGRVLLDSESRDCLLRRLSRIEGQFRGIRKMVGEGRECLDVIQQITAVREAISMLGIELLKDDFVCHRTGKNIDEKFLKTLFKMR
ncbi:MAG: metal-sensitive transcriptional regulator [Candidatus Moranbacteria bacterium]|nr:metal-sensitive transcriptional regulator [Candidatus Moranbacteria bacterium]